MKEFTFWVSMIVATLVLIIGGSIIIGWGIDKLNEPYLTECRDRGGVPVSTGRGSYNCAGPNGGWLDV